MEIFIGCWSFRLFNHIFNIFLGNYQIFRRGYVYQCNSLHC